MTDRTQNRPGTFNDTYTATNRGETELVFTRKFAAPAALVWQVITDPAHIQNWWGPYSATTTVDFMDVRVGGSWRFLCEDAGETHPFRGTFLELVPGVRIVQTFEYEGLPGALTETTTLTEVDGVTTMTVVSVFPTGEDRDRAMEYGMADGSRQSYERLAAVLERL
jgi:uncharacterized protein YndB with AHSA1/START domain